MIDILFYFGTQIVIVRVKGRDLFFGHTLYGAQMAPFKGIQLNRTGVTKEFPDLADDEEWKEKAIQRFEEKLLNMKSEEEIASYVIDDLKKYGYIPKLIQRAGFRPRPIN